MKSIKYTSQEKIPNTFRGSKSLTQEEMNRMEPRSRFEKLEDWTYEYDTFGRKVVRQLIYLPGWVGECIRFAVDSFEEALQADLFWIRVDAPEAKDRIRLINSKDGKQIEKDGDHRVIVHNTSLQIEE